MLVFTRGMGEHDSATRAEMCHTLSFLGVKIHAEQNARHAAEI